MCVCVCALASREFGGVITPDIGHLVLFCHLRYKHTCPMQWKVSQMTKGIDHGTLTPQRRDFGCAAIEWPLGYMRIGDFFSVLTRDRSWKNVRNSVYQEAAKVDRRGAFRLDPFQEGGKLITVRCIDIGKEREARWEARTAKARQEAQWLDEARAKREMALLLS